MINLKKLIESLDPTSFGPNPGATEGCYDPTFYQTQNDKMRHMEEAADNISGGPDPSFYQDKMDKMREMEPSYIHIGETESKFLPDEVSDLIDETVDDVIERYGGSKKERGIWYHGTSSDRIPSIMSQGLNPNIDPKKKSWESDPDVSAYSIDRTSYGGIYVTQNLSTATGASLRTSRKNKSHGAIFIMELQPRSLIADEDDFTTRIKDLRDNLAGSIYHAIYPYMWETYGAPHYHTEYAKTNKDNWINKSMDTLFYELKIDDDRLKAATYKLLSDEGYKAMLTRIVGHLKKSDSFSDYWEWRKAYADVHGMKDYSEKVHIPDPPSPSEGEATFRKFVDKLTRTMKHKARHSFTDSYSKTARCMEPIGFKGSNRIVAVLELVPSKTVKYGDDLKVIYGELPEDFKQQWIARVGELRLVNEEKIGEVLTESMDVYIKGVNSDDKFETILDISFHLMRKIINPLYNSFPPDQQAYFNKNRTGDVLTSDGDDHFNRVGILNFYTNGFTINSIHKILLGIIRECKKINLTVGKLKREQSRMYKSQVIRIPIVKNESSYSGPPELNLCNRNAFHIFKEILQFEPDDASGSSFSFKTQNLIDAIEGLKHDPAWIGQHQIKSTDTNDEPPIQQEPELPGDEWKHVDDTPDEPSENPHDDILKGIGNAFGGARMISGKLDSEDIRNRIEKILEIALWAKQHGHSEMYVA